MEDNMTLEESFEKLQEIVDTMEGGELGLSESFVKYKEGITLVNQCNEMIDKVEKEVKLINSKGEMTEFEA